VIIDVPEAITVTHSTGFDLVHSIKSTEALNLSGGTLDVASTVEVTNTFSLSGGTLANATVAADTTINADTANGSTLDGVTLDGALNVNGVSLDIVHGLTLGSGTLTLSGGADVIFSGTQSLGGTGDVVFGDGNSSNVVEASSGTTLTIGPDVTVHGNTGTFGGSQSGISFDNEGTINADVLGGTITLTGDSLTNTGNLEASNGGFLAVDYAAWSNQGHISATSGGTVDLGGLFTTADLGSFQSQTGGIVGVSGILDNTNGPLTLNSTTGSLHLLDGIIEGGTVNTSGGAELAADSLYSSGTLEDVTLAGTLAITNSSAVSVTGGLTLDNGEVDISGAGILNFDGNQTLGGTGKVDFTDSNPLNQVEAEAGATLTIGPDVTISGSAGVIGGFPGSTGSPIDLINQGTIESLAASDGFGIDLAGTSLTNHGILKVDTSGILAIDTSFCTNDGSITAADIGNLSAAGDFSNSGSLDVGPGSVFAITGGFTQGSSGSLEIGLAGTDPTMFGEVQVGGAASLGGTLDVNLVNGFSPAVGNSFEILTFASHSGNFATSNGLDLGNGRTLNPLFASGNLSLLTVATPPLVTAPLNQNADVGIAKAFSLGSFSDVAAEGPWSVDVNWGDNTQDTTFTASTAGSLGTQSHQFASAGNHTVMVTVTNKDQAHAGTSFQVTANAQPVVTAAANQSATVNVSTSFALGSFTSVTAEGPWSVDVNWGDNTQDTTFTATTAGTLAAQSHTYTSAATDTVTVTVTDQDGGKGTGTFQVKAVSAPAVTAAANQNADAGVTKAFALGSFSDVAAEGPWSVDVNWGDNTQDTTFTASTAGSLGTQSHQFAATGSHTVMVTVTNKDEVAGSASFQVTANAQPLVTAAATQSAAVNVSTLFSLGSFTSVTAEGPWSVDVNWGDNSQDTTFTATAAGTLTGQSHKYTTATTESVTVTVADQDGGKGTGNFQVNVLSAPAVTAAAGQSADAGIAKAFALGSFSDVAAEGPWSVDVNWGDNSQDTTFTAATAGSLGTQSHQFAATGSHTVMVTVTNKDHVAGSASFQVTANAQPVVTAAATQNATVTVSTLFSLGSFTSVASEGPWSVDVNWGDNSQDTTFTAAAAGTLTAQSHKYTTATTETVTVTVTDQDGGKGAGSFQVNVFAGPAVTAAANQSADAGIAKAFSLGSFSDVAAEGPWSVDVNWGDNTPDTTFTASTAGSLGTQSHQFTTAGPHTVMVTVTDKDQVAGSGSFQVTANAPPVVTAAATQSASVNVSTLFSLGSFTSVTAEGPWSVDVNWGDNSQDTTFTASAAGTLTAQSHKYTTATTEAVTVTVTDQDGGKGTGSFQVNVLSPPAVTAAAGQSADAGIAKAFSLGSFSDVAAEGPWSVDVNWGDNTQDTVFTAATAGSLGTQSHQFTTAGAHAVMVTVTNKDHVAGSASFQVTANAQPVVTAAATQSASINVSESFSLGSFTSVTAEGPWSVDVNWGDNSQDTTFTASAAGTLTAQSHKYTTATAETVTVTVTDQDGGKGTGSFQVNVGLPPVVTAAAGQSADTGIAKAFALGSFSDVAADGPWSVDVNWGDNTQDTVFTAATAGSLGTQSHQFAAPGPHTVLVTVTNKDQGQGSASFQVTANAPPVVTAAATQSAVVNVSESFSLGSFTSVAGEGPWSVDVNWGDNTQDTTFTASAAGTLTAQSHKYTTATTETVTVTVTDQDGGKGTGSFQVNVGLPPAVTPASSQSADTGIAKAISLGSFSDVAAEGPWSVDINWGDNTQDTVFTASTAGTLGTQSHQYSVAGPHTVLVTVTNKDQGQGSASFQVTASAPPVAAIGGLPATSPEGTEIALTGSPSAASGLTYSWSVTTNNNTVASGTTQDFTFTPSEEGAYTVTLQVTDNNGGSSKDVQTVTVTDVPPTPHISGLTEVTANDVYTLNLSGGATGVEPITGWVINWGDGTVQDIPGNPSSATHIFQAPEGMTTYVISAAAVDDDGQVAADSTVSVMVAVPGETMQTVSGSPGTPMTASAGTITATLMLPASAGQGTVSLTVGTYTGDPTTQPINGIVFEDVHISATSGVDLSQGRLTITFEGVTSGSVEYFNKTTGTWDTVVPLSQNQTAAGLQITLGPGSTPSIQDLTSTVFTVAILNPVETTTTLTPAVALAGTASGATSDVGAASLSSSATFTSGSPLTLVLTASQNSQLTSTRATVDQGKGGGQSGPAATGDDLLWQLFWLLDEDEALRLWQRLGQAPANPAAPVAQEAPAPSPASPAATLDAIDATFLDTADFDETWDPVQPETRATPVPDAAPLLPLGPAEDQTQLSTGWAMMAALTGAMLRQRTSRDDESEDP
jgi:hypothetical protein